MIEKKEKNMQDRRVSNQKSEMRNHKLPGFTLIELLVVVAIIAVLIAMLLPAMTKARKQARTVADQSNFRQLGMLIQVYADTNADWLPPGMNYSNYWEGTWWGELAKLMGFGKNEFEYHRSDGQRQIFFCTEKKYVLDNGNSAGYTYSWQIHNGTGPWYDASGFGNRGKRGHGYDDELRVILYCSWPFTYIDSPYVPWGPPSAPSYERWYFYLSKEHNNGANFLYIDGHVNWIADRGRGWLYDDRCTTNKDVKWR